MASALVGVLTTGNAVALGLGDIEAKSALNQPFNAEVSLLSATDEELNELKVELASSDAFTRAGIDRTLFLSRLNFAVVQNASGKPVIHVTSREAVTEPFLDFLVEVSWSKGRLLREYTVLIDPPVTMPAAPVVTQAPPVSAPTALGQPVSESARVVNETARGRVVQGQAAVTGGASEYGPTRRNDTLWQIAQQVRPDNGVSVEQTMLALLRENPQAFIDNNINNLKAGYVLRIPDRGEITQVSRTQARAEARSQYDAWQAGRSASGGAATPNTDKPSLQLLAPDATDAAAGLAGKTDSTAVESLKRDLVLANEALEAQRLEAADANSRVLVLEEQVQNMRRLIDLKDSELARLQALAGETPAKAEPAATASGDQVAAPEAIATEVDSGSQADAEAIPLGSEAPATPAAEAGPAGTETQVNPVSPTEAATPENSETKTGETKPSEASEAVPTSGEQHPESLGERAGAFFQTLLAKATGNPVWLGVGGALLLLLAMFGLRRKQAADDSDFQESILRSPNDEDQVDEGTSGFSQPIAEPAQGGQSSLLSEFAVSDMTDADGDGAADPLAEADVYLAYGRYQQAADLVKEALESEPGRDDLDLKLLEIYQAAGQDDEFDAHAQSVLERLGDSEHPLWKRVSEMGVSVNPRNPVYALGPAVGAAGEAAWTNAATERPEPSADEPDMSDVLDSADIPPAIVSGAGAMADNSLEFDLEGFDLGDDEGEAGDGELADMDEVSTKLDLARAYIDMGDSDGAKSILDEVIEEGTEEQRSEAHDILQRLAS